MTLDQLLITLDAEENEVTTRLIWDSHSKKELGEWIVNERLVPDVITYPFSTMKDKLWKKEHKLDSIVPNSLHTASKVTFYSNDGGEDKQFIEEEGKERKK